MRYARFKVAGMADQVLVNFDHVVGIIQVSPTTSRLHFVAGGPWTSLDIEFSFDALGRLLDA